ncbi:MAG TPA: phosphatase PAP2 family protein [Actinomycetes bacterium]|nr:phosphatase PAP2 family protein [Actinomycetes bacterium]
MIAGSPAAGPTGVAAGAAPAVTRARPRRRPSGEPPPLPRELQTSGKWWLGLAAAVLVFWVVVAVTRRTAVSVDVLDNRVLEWFTSLRSDPLTAVMKVAGVLGTAYALQALWYGNLLVLVIWRRWRHLFVWLGATLTVVLIANGAEELIRRPRPVGVEIIGPWEGFAMPSRPMAVLAAVLVSGLYSLVPSGRLRRLGKLAVAVALLVTAVSRLYLAQDGLTDIVAGVVLGVAIPLAAFRLLAPNEVFPITYRRGRTAHLDVTGRRLDAIQHALRDQLGVIPLEIKPFGLAGSGGSTPLRVKVKGEPDSYLFCKLYAATHLRSDRWYKLGRTLLYGRLEDERAFNTVRRLVQYEDYISRLMRSADLPVAQPYGIVEITPEREYLLVTEFHDGAVEVGDAEVDDSIIDQGLEIVRRLWEAGLAHRDIKPANLLVRSGRLVLVDPAFAMVRPSPWRQAVDLGNMMLVLALRTDAARVYGRARRLFSEEEIAEAFAATRGLTMPSQLRRLLRQQGRDLHAEFTTLLPTKLPSVRIQRWSWRRVALTASVALGVIFGAVIAVSLLTSPL